MKLAVGSVYMAVSGLEIRIIKLSDEHVWCVGKGRKLVGTEWVTAEIKLPPISKRAFPRQIESVLST
jgi:hypothetical protein